MSELKFKEGGTDISMLKGAIEDIVEALAIIHDKLADGTIKSKRLKVIVENFKDIMKLDF